MAVDSYTLEALEPIERAKVVVDNFHYITRDMVAFVADISDENIRKTTANIFLMKAKSRQLSNNAVATLRRAIGEYKSRSLGSLPRPYEY